VPAVHAFLGDITTLDVDVIVNAANSELAPGGGVCGAIHRAAGPQLARACAQVAPCPIGEARITPGFLLQARFVIHAVGPMWRGGGAREAALLASAYSSSMALARAHGLTSIAFPAISTGIYGYPLHAATRIAVETIGGELTHGGVRAVTFACFNRQSLEEYRAAGVPGATL
jgi:O-acetyl-ADP-ribose deacetylase (regulator of RNase III)